MLPGGNQNENILHLMYGRKHRLSRISRKKCIQVPNIRIVILLQFNAAIMPCAQYAFIYNYIMYLQLYIILYCIVIRIQCLNLKIITERLKDKVEKILNIPS